MRGLARLASAATVGVSRIAEGVHQSVWDTLGVPGGAGAGRTGGLTGLVYETIRGVTSLVGEGVDRTMSGVERVLRSSVAPEHEPPERAAILAALNGVLGDQLVDRGNALATPMTLRYRGRIVDDDAGPSVEGATGKIVVLIHGLCMNDRQWRTVHDGERVDHGSTLAACGYTPVCLRYNTGLHTSVNGRALAARMARLVARWPVPVEEIAVLAHSMGGLVARGAIHYAQRAGLGWTALLRHLVFLGTPHHGVPLERAGSWVDALLKRSIYTAPFGALPHLRSAGITDLRHGHVVDEDWQGRDRFEHRADARRILPLPERVACYAIAATTTAKRGVVADHMVGDGLVPLASALGEHRDPRRRLMVQPACQRVVYGTHHLELLSRPEVGRQVARWLSRPDERALE